LLRSIEASIAGRGDGLLRVFLEPGSTPGTIATSAKICCVEVSGLLIAISIDVSTALEMAICLEIVLCLMLGDLSLVVAKFVREKPT